MKAAKFPYAAQLFKFCHKVMCDLQGRKVHDQEVGAVIDFNPSDCSHWKKGDKSVKSVFALEKLATAIGVEITLIHELASGLIGLDEAYFEYSEARSFNKSYQKALSLGPDVMQQTRDRVQELSNKLHQQANFATPPLYLPEVMRFLSFVRSQPAEIMNRLSRVLRIKSNQYTIQYKKGELRAQTRMSIVADLARIILEGERHRYPELGQLREDLLGFERYTFIANLLLPKDLLRQELAKVDARKNAMTELSALFWAPKSLIGYQLQEIIREQLPNRPTTSAPRAASYRDEVRSDSPPRN